MTTNLWTTGQGFITRRLMPKPDLTAAQAKRSSRTPPKEQPPPKQKTGQPPAPADGVGATPRVAGPPRRVKRKRSGGGKRR
jgi:hypothetical protein